jgi:hypothetical protein
LRYEKETNKSKNESRFEQAVVSAIQNCNLNHEQKEEFFRQFEAELEIASR